MDFSRIKIERRNPRPVEYSTLRKGAGLPPFDPQKLEKGLDHSLFSVCISYEGKTIGCGRVLGDGALHFYIQDLLIAEDFREEGIDAMIMDVIMAYIKNMAGTNSFIGVMTTTSGHELFIQYGFTPLADPALGMQLLWKK